jgi:membrane protein implicated in regulation of membrane protease activity
MIAYLQQLAFWDWLGLATALLVLEVFGTGGYLLWAGLSAVTVGTLTFLIPNLPWRWQFLLFVTLGLLTMLSWWRHQQRVR